MKGVVVDLACAIDALRRAQENLMKRMITLDPDSTEWENLAFLDDELNGKVNELTDKANALSEPLIDPDYWIDERNAEELERYNNGEIALYELVLRQD